METSNSTHKISAKIRLLLCALVILFGLFIMILPIGKPFLLSESFVMNSSTGLLQGILIALFLPTIIYSLITIKTNKIEYIHIAETSDSENIRNRLFQAFSKQNKNHPSIKSFLSIDDRFSG